MYAIWCVNWLSARHDIKLLHFKEIEENPSPSSPDPMQAEMSAKRLT